MRARALLRCPHAYHAWLVAQWGALAGLLGVAALLDPLRASVAIGREEPGALLGLGLWALLAFVTSVRAIPMPDGGYLTLSLAPILAASLLGGPLAGGIVSLVGTLEWRELRGSVPVDALADNRATVALPALVAGFAMDALRGGVADPLRGALVAGLGALLMIAGNDVLGTISRRLRQGHGVLRTWMRTWFLRFALAALGWLMAEMTLRVGWWSVLVVALPLVAVRDAVRTEDVARRNGELARTARTDALTGLANRLRLTEDLAALRARLERRGGSAAFVLLDLDRFKALNDRFGHLAGDAALVQTAAALAAQVRADERLYRYGGEEFLAVLEGCDEDGLRRAAERLAGSVAEAGIAHPDNAPWPVLTASAGAALVHPGDPDAIDAALRAADRALFAAKAAGRNRALVDGGDGPPRATQGSAGPGRVGQADREGARTGPPVAPVGVDGLP